MSDRFEIEEVFIECENCLALSLGFKSPADPLDVLHIVTNRASAEEPELYLERTDQAISCVNQVSTLSYNENGIILQLTESGAKSMRLGRVTTFSFEKHLELRPIVMRQLIAIREAGHAAIISV